VVENGFGKHAEVAGVPAVLTFYKCLYIFEIVYPFPIAMTKFSILLYYKRLFRVQSIRIPIFVVAGLIGCWLIYVVSVSGVSWRWYRGREIGWLTRGVGSSGDLHMHSDPQGLGPDGRGRHMHRYPQILHWDCGPEYRYRFRAAGYAPPVHLGLARETPAEDRCDVRLRARRIVSHPSQGPSI
jgi:hypothetical protein